MTLPKLYPNHQHQWVDAARPCTCPRDPDDYDDPGPYSFNCPVHGWSESALVPSPTVACTVCGFTAPRTLAKLAGHGDDPGWHDQGVVGTVVPDPDNGIPWQPDMRCTHQDAAGQCLDHQGHTGDHQHPQPEQEST